MRRIPAFCLGCLAILACTACQPRMPLSRTEASAAARNWCVRDGHAWGDPVELVEPSAADADDRRFWTVRFKEQAGERRILLVNADSGWVKRAP